MKGVRNNFDFLINYVDNIQLARIFWNYMKTDTVKKYLVENTDDVQKQWIIDKFETEEFLRIKKREMQAGLRRAYEQINSVSGQKAPHHLLSMKNYYEKGLSDISNRIMYKYGVGINKNQITNGKRQS